jgi:hypothetical protein
MPFDVIWTRYGHVADTLADYDALNNTKPLRKNMSESDSSYYQSYLVRCWFIPPVTADEAPTWRFEVQAVTAEPQKYRFSDFEQLTTFIAARLTAVAANNTQDKDNEGNRKGDKP